MAEHLLLVHGFPLDGRMWRRQVEGLSSGDLIVLAPHLPGHGASPVGNPETSMDGIARALANRLDEEGVPRVHLGGFSMGGYVALAFTRLFPERVQSLILVDTKATADTDAGRAGRDEMAAKIREGGSRVAVEAMLPKMFTEGVDAAARAEIEQVMLAQPPGALVADLAAMRDRPDSTPGLAAIKAPVLVIVGEEDGITPPSDAQAIVDAVPGAKLVTVPGAAHLAPVEQASAVNEAIKSFIG